MAASLEFSSWLELTRGFVGIREPFVGTRGRLRRNSARWWELTRVASSEFDCPSWEFGVGFVGIQPVGGNSWSLRRNSARWWEFGQLSSELSPLVGIRGRFVGIHDLLVGICRFVGIRDPLVGIRGAFVGTQPIRWNSGSLRRNSRPVGGN